MTNTDIVHLKPQEQESVPMGQTGVTEDMWLGQQHSLTQPEWDKWAAIRISMGSRTFTQPH